MLDQMAADLCPARDEKVFAVAAGLPSMVNSKRDMMTPLTRDGQRPYRCSYVYTRQIANAAIKFLRRFVERRSQ